MSACTAHQMTNHHDTAFGQIAGLLRTWQRRHAERWELAHWSERDLNDVGLSRDDIALEIEKPFWRG